MPTSYSNGFLASITKVSLFEISLFHDFPETYLLSFLLFGFILNPMEQLHFLFLSYLCGMVEKDS